MSYIFKQKFSLQDLAPVEKQAYRVLIHEPEEYLSAIYGNYMRTHAFEVRHCPNLLEVKNFVRNFSPALLVFNVGSTESLLGKLAWLASFKKEFPQIWVVTTGFGLETEMLKKLMDLGVASHLNRQLSRPQDLAIIVKSILQN